MKWKFVGLLAVVSCFTAASVSGQGMFRVTFRASGKTLNQFNQETEAIVTHRDIVAAAVAARGLPARSARNYALVYNATNDSLQVVSESSGTILVNVIRFEGGAATSDQPQS